MLNNDTQFIVGIIIFIIITITIWALSIKSYNRTGRIDLRFNIVMNFGLPFVIILLLKLCMPIVYIVGENERIDEYINLIGSSVEMNNDQIITIYPFESVLLNNTNTALILEKVTYGHSPVNHNNEINVRVNPYSKQKTKRIDFFFTTPPNSISVKHRTKVEKIWLHL